MTDMSLNFTCNATNCTPCISYELSPSEVEESKASETFRAVFMSLIVFVGITGNGFVIRGALRREKRPFVYYLVINLALAEIVICCLHPFQMVVDRPPYFWQAGPFMCNLVRALEVGMSLIVTYTLAAIAIYRAVVITQPKISRPSKGVAYGIMTISWIWGAAFAIPYGMNRKLNLYKDPCLPVIIKSCDIIELKPVFDTAYKIGFFYIPFVVMLASYGVVIYKIKKHTHLEAARRREESIELSNTATMNTSLEENEAKPQKCLQNTPANCLALNQKSEVNQPNREEKKQGKIFDLEKDVLNLLYILILIFFICYIPWTIQYMLLHVAKVESVRKWPYRKIFEWYKTLVRSLPSALHPICYGVASKVPLGAPCVFVRRGVRWFNRLRAPNVGSLPKQAGRYKT